jgi:two-component system NtrC family response regulator
VPNNINILIIDDEVDVGNFFRRLLRRKAYDLTVALSGKEAREQINTGNFHVAMVDLKLPDADGLELLQEIKSVKPNCEVIIMTGYSTARTAVKAIQSGAFDYIEKPFDDILVIEELIEKALEFGKKMLGDTDTQPDWLPIAARIGYEVGNSPAMLRLVSMADKIARKNINVLIQGETGTGKEVLANFIHEAGNRTEYPFVAVNCGALPENLLESELFGHEKGSFTGAANQRKGIFELANKGTLFLDEIGEASLSIQVKLLRVLETGEFMRVGGEKPIHTDVRVIAATNVDLEKAVRDKTFREDLFYRLDVVRLLIPSLREHKEDIPVLVNYFLNKFKNKYSSENMTFSKEAMELLLEHAWPGNIRELANTVDQSMALCDGQIILPAHLSKKFSGKKLAVDSGANGDDSVKNIPVNEIKSYLGNSLSLIKILSADTENLPELLPVLRELSEELKKLCDDQEVCANYSLNLQEVESITVARALSRCKGNISVAAKLLGIGRNTLYRKIKDYGLSV